MRRQPLEVSPRTRVYPAVEHRAPGRWEVGHREVRREEGEVLFRVLRAGFCASDWKIFLGYKAVKAGVVPGHEIAVEVVEDPTGRWEKGQRGSLYPILFCGACEACERGMTHHCTRKVSLGYARDGGFAAYVQAPASLLVPTDLEDPERFVFAEPVATVLWGLSRVVWDGVDRVMIWGLGTMGLLHAQVIRARYPRVHIVGWDPRESRQTLARPFLDEITPDGESDLAVVATGSQRALQQALQAVRPGGQVVLFSSYYREAGVVDANTVHYRDLRVVGTHSAPLRTMHEAMRLLEESLDPRPLITHRVPLREVQVLLDAYRRMDVLKGILIP